MPEVSMIGLISDTHGLLRNEALPALRECELIIHAGDVGDPDIIGQLRAIAPVVAVRGNVDKGKWATLLPETAIVDACRARIYILHDVNQLETDQVEGKFDIVVSGHSHKPGRTERNNILYINPGSAGPRRFRLPVTLARLDLRYDPWRVEFIDLLQSLT